MEAEEGVKEGGGGGAGAVWGRGERAKAEDTKRAGVEGRGAREGIWGKVSVGALREPPWSAGWGAGLGAVVLPGGHCCPVRKAL